MTNGATRVLAFQLSSITEILAVGVTLAVHACAEHLDGIQRPPGSFMRPGRVKETIRRHGHWFLQRHRHKRTMRRTRRVFRRQDSR